MSYLGNTPTTQSFISGTDYFNGTGAQTAFTLSRTVASINDIQVTVNNVVQQPNSGYTISGTTLTFDQAPSAGTQNVYVRYLSTTTQAITPSQNTVSWNTLDSNIQQDLGVMYKNRIINGNMVIDQRNAGASVTPSSGVSVYTVDRWQAYVDANSSITVQQSSVAPTGFVNSLLITSTAATTPSSGQIFLIRQKIEGFNTADLNWGTANAKTVTLSFWVRSSLTGTFGGVVKNSAGNRSYPFTFTISSANTFEYKTITIAGDTTGTWLTTNGIGIYLSFSLGAGSSKLGTAGAWVGSDFDSATGAVNFVATNGATFYLTGVQLEVGTQATAFSTAGGSYGAELALCQRYFSKSWNIETAVGTGTNIGAMMTRVYNTDPFIPQLLTSLPVVMRATPAVTSYDTLTGAVNRLTQGGVSRTVSNVFDIGARTSGFPQSATNPSSGDDCRWHFTASAEL